MEVVSVHDFQFDSTTSTPYASAPSSPKRFGDPYNYYYQYGSAPTSPARAAAIYAEFGHLSPTSISPAAPFSWEEDPPDTPKSSTGEDDFAFDFSGQLEKGMPALPTAAELFDKGKIRPLKPPPRLLQPAPNDRRSNASSPVSPRSRGLWSPRHSRDAKADPFTAAMVEVTTDRGRERSNPLSHSSSRSRKGSRSLSPMRAISAPSTPSTSSTTPLKSGGSKKWRLKDLFLFRSASEGRATGNRSKDPLNKYTMLPSSSSSSPLLLPPPTNKRGVRNDSMGSSFRSTDSSGSMRRGSGAAVSAHELHYAANRAASEESKKKTPLPYQQGLFGCLGFNPAISSIARGLNSYSFNRRS